MPWSSLVLERHLEFMFDFVLFNQIGFITSKWHETQSYLLRSHWYCYRWSTRLNPNWQVVRPLAECSGKVLRTYGFHIKQCKIAQWLVRGRTGPTSTSLCVKLIRQHQLRGIEDNSRIRCANCNPDLPRVYYRYIWDTWWVSSGLSLFGCRSP